MDTNEIKDLLRKHYDHATPGQGNYYEGEWYTPKADYSLSDLLSEMDCYYCDQTQMVADLHKKVEDLEGQIDALQFGIEEQEETERELEE